MRNTFSFAVASTLLLFTSILIWGWVRSYLIVDIITHIYPKIPGNTGHWAAVEGERLWISPSTKCTEVAIAAGRIIIDHPWIDGAPIGWEHRAEKASGFLGLLPVNRFGFSMKPDLVVIPVWPLVCSVAVISAFLFCWRFRKRRRVGFEVSYIAEGTRARR
jgi:hypothetical protein